MTGPCRDMGDTPSNVGGIDEAHLRLLLLTAVNNVALLVDLEKYDGGQLHSWPLDYWETFAMVTRNSASMRLPKIDPDQITALQNLRQQLRRSGADLVIMHDGALAMHAQRANEPTKDSGQVYLNIFVTHPQGRILAGKALGYALRNVFGKDKNVVVNPSDPKPVRETSLEFDSGANHLTTVGLANGRGFSLALPSRGRPIEIDNSFPEQLPVQSEAAARNYVDSRNARPQLHRRAAVEEIRPSRILPRTTKASTEETTLGPGRTRS